MAGSNKIDRKEIILVSIAIALSTALVGIFQKLIEDATENESGINLVAAWGISLLLWITFVMVLVIIILRVFGYKMKD